jgi:hypothetical protein
MKAHRNQTTASDTFEFVRQQPRNVLRVEHDESVARIQAARDNLSEREKEFFVRYLAAEGFLTKTSSSFAGQGPDELLKVEWYIDAAPAGAELSDSIGSRRARNFMVRLIVYSSLFWLVQLSVLLLTSA